jgi:hypothetical protein
VLWTVREWAPGLGSRPLSPKRFCSQYLLVVISFILTLYMGADLYDKTNVKEIKNIHTRGEELDGSAVSVLSV